MSRYPKSLAANRLLATILAAEGRDEDALRQYQLVVAVDPLHAEDYSGMASLAGRLGRHHEAGAYETIASDHRGKDSNGLAPIETSITPARLGILNERSGLLAQAVNQLRRVVEAERSRLDLYLVLARSLLFLRLSEETEHVLSAILTSAPDCLEANVIAAVLATRAGHRQEAQSHLDKAFACDPAGVIIDELWSAQGLPIEILEKRGDTLAEVSEPLSSASRRSAPPMESVSTAGATMPSFDSNAPEVEPVGVSGDEGLGTNLPFSTAFESRAEEPEQDFTESSWGERLVDRPAQEAGDQLNREELEDIEARAVSEEEPFGAHIADLADGPIGQSAEDMEATQAIPLAEPASGTRASQEGAFPPDLEDWFQENVLKVVELESAPESRTPEGSAGPARVEAGVESGPREHDTETGPTEEPSPTARSLDQQGPGQSDQHGRAEGLEPARDPEGSPKQESPPDVAAPAMEKRSARRWAMPGRDWKSPQEPVKSRLADLAEIVEREPLNNGSRFELAKALEEVDPTQAVSQYAIIVGSRDPRLMAGVKERLEELLAHGTPVHGLQRLLGDAYMQQGAYERAIEAYSLAFAELRSRQITDRGSGL